MVSALTAPWGTRQRSLSAEPSCSRRLLFQEQREWGRRASGRALGVRQRSQTGGPEPPTALATQPDPHLSWGVLATPLASAPAVKAPALGGWPLPSPGMAIGHRTQWGPADGLHSCLGGWGRARRQAGCSGKAPQGPVIGKGGRDGGYTGHRLPWSHGQSERKAQEACLTQWALGFLRRHPNTCSFLCGLVSGFRQRA